jgi:hypothetical protein
MFWSWVAKTSVTFCSSLRICSHRDRTGGALLQQHFQRMLVELVREDVKALASKGPGASIPQEAIVRYIAGGLWGMLAWWMDGQMRMSVEDVNRLFRRLAIPALSEAVSSRLK